MRNDIERAMDTVLSSLTVDAARQEQLIRSALQAKRETPAHKPGLSFRFAPSHRLVAALLVVLLLLLPLFTPPQKDAYIRYSSEDGQDYFITGNADPTPSTGASADPAPYTTGSYKGTSFEEAAAVYGADLPHFTWLPEGARLEHISVSSFRRMRTANCLYADPYVCLGIDDHFTGEFGNTCFPQDDAGEYRTLSDSQQVYITTNHDKITIVWQKGFTIYFLSTEASLEDAIRMIESIR